LFLLIYLLIVVVVTDTCMLTVCSVFSTWCHRRYLLSLSMYRYVCWHPYASLSLSLSFYACVCVGVFLCVVFV